MAPDIFNCCVIGFHGARSPLQNTNSNGNAKVQTFAWAIVLSPGRLRPPEWRCSTGRSQDIHPLSHEIAEWADDPFVNNTGRAVAHANGTAIRMHGHPRDR